MYQTLSKCILFKGLDAEEIQNSLGKITFQKKTYDADVPIAFFGEECDRLILVVHGEVRGEMSDSSGKKIKIEDIEAPSPVASAFIFGQHNKFPVTITTNISSEIIVIYRQELLSLFQVDKQILSNYLTLISNRAQFLTNKIRFLSFGTIKEKLAHYIASMAGTTRHSFQMDKTQSQLADLFGVQRPSVGRALKEMQDEQIIALNTKTITIIDRERLGRLLANRKHY